MKIENYKLEIPPPTPRDDCGFRIEDFGFPVAASMVVPDDRP
jgi:hypothetical protein